MGVIRPPWISKKWFSKCPFNYCDHFGDKEILSKICKICAEDEKRTEKYKKEGKDPYAIENVLKDIAENFANTMITLHQQAKKMGIDLDNLPDVDEETIIPETFPIYGVVSGYGQIVEELMKKIYPIFEKTRSKFLYMVYDVMAHSRHYIIAKIVRALHSKYEREDDEIGRELADSKTSAFYAYVAIKRNVAAGLALARRVKSIDRKEKFLEFAHLSQEVAEGLRFQFFPNDELIYREIGCEEYDRVFSTPRKVEQRILN